MYITYKVELGAIVLQGYCVYIWYDSSVFITQALVLRHLDDINIFNMYSVTE